MVLEKKVLLVLRVGLAFAFLYPAVSAYFNPFAWIGYFPLFVLEIVGNDTLTLHTFGVVEIIIALWLLWGKHIFYPSLLALFMLVGIVAFNFNQMDILFRDLGIAAMAFALVLASNPYKLSREKSHTETQETPKIQE